MRFQVNVFLLFDRELQPRFVMGTVQPRLTRQAALSLGGADEIQDRRITLQRFARPIQTNETEQSMLNRIPFRGACWKMRYSNRQWV